MKRKKCLSWVFFLAVSLTSCCLIFAQKAKRFDYYKQECTGDGTSKILFTAAKKNNAYTFHFPGDTIFTFAPEILKRGDTIVSAPSYGPYFFKKKGRKIMVSTDGRFFYVLYLLTNDDYFLIPDIFSGSIDAAIFRCRYLGDSSFVFLNDQKEPCYKFLELPTEGVTSDYRIVYLSKQNLIPLRIESYSDNGLRNCLSIVICKSF